MAKVGSEQIGAQQVAGALYRDVPTVAVTAPSGPQNTSTVTVTWTYTSAVSKPAVSFRVEILNQFGSGVLFDSGTITGADTSYDSPFVLSGGSTYQVRVSVSDGVDVGVGTSAFSADLTTAADIDPETDVGSVYEIGINGSGYRLADSPRTPYKRSTGQLQAPRLATGDTPFSEAIERYSFSGAGDWTLGAGQRTADRQASDPRAFWDSENVNPFNPGRLELLPATEELLSVGASTVGAVVASGHLFAATAADSVSRLTTPAGSPSAMAFTGDTLGGLASDGTHWYAWNTDDEIFKGTDTTIGSAWTDLSTEGSIDLIEWVTDRLAVVYENGSGQSVFSTLGPDGTEEVANGRALFTDASIVAVTSGDGYVWFAVNRSDRSVVYAWQLGSEDAPFVALELPKGETATALGFYLGNVLVRASRTESATVYRAVPAAGELTPERVCDLPAAAGVGPFIGLDRFVLFGWAEMSDDGRSGVGAIDLSTGGWCRWLQAPTSGDDGAVTALFAWEGLAGFVVDGHGVQYTDPDTLSASGFVQSSVSDLGSGLTKVIDSIELTTEPLPNSSSVGVAVSYDGGVSFTDAGSVNVPGTRGGDWALGRQASSFATRLTLAATGSTSPLVTVAQVKLHPLSVVDTIVELPVDCSDRMAGANRVEIQDNQPSGMARARLLESLVGTRVLFQDVDWPVTGVAEVWEMVSAVYQSQGTFERRTGKREETAPVCLVTLRRAQ